VENITTITIDNAIKNELLKIGALLQMKFGKKINYNTTIKFLIENFKKRMKNEELFREACSKIENVNINEILNELYIERKKDERSI